MKTVIQAVLVSVLTVSCCAGEMENLALKATATASSFQASEFAPNKAIDGRGNTRWSSNRNDNEWFMLDFGEPKTVGQIRLDWEAAAGKEYVIQFSDDGKNFTDIFTVNNGRGGAREFIRIKPRETRYIRILGKKRATHYGYSLWEIMVYPASDNLAFDSTATASSSQSPELAPAKAVDGRSDTRWSSNRNDNEWFMVDLGSERTIGRLVLKWEYAAGKEYSVQVSTDGENFSEVFHKNDGKSKATENITFDPRNVRYIRIQGIKRATSYGYSLWEVEAFEK